ncbi:hypothetical protein VTI74DRAFT_10373 [Chaetomium olivicolor]
MRPLQLPNLDVHSLSRAFRLRQIPRQPSSTPRLRQPLKPKRLYSTTPNPPSNPTPTTSTTTQTPTDKASRILARLPRPLQRYTTRLRGAPLTHVVAFLILHEITAVVPLFGLFGLFHYTDHVPISYMMEHYGGYVREGMGRFERYFTRKGWFGFGEGGQKDGEGAVMEAGGGSGAGEGRVEGAEVQQALDRWETDPKYKVVVEVALAYALTKVLLPVRIVGSLWATPWFAGVLGKVRRVVGR